MAGPRPETSGSPAPSPAAEPDIAAVLEALTDEARLMLRRDVELAKAEIRGTTRHAGGAGAGFGAAALLGYLAVALLAVAAALGLSAVMPVGLAFLVVGLVVAAAAGVAYAVGRRNLAALTPVPHQTIETIKQDISWLRAQMS